MPTLADLAKQNQQSAVQPRTAGASRAASKQLAKTGGARNRPLSSPQPATTKSARLDDQLDLNRDDLVAYLAMRLGIAPKRLRAALTDYDRRRGAGADNRPTGAAHPSASQPNAPGRPLSNPPKPQADMDQSAKHPTPTAPARPLAEAVASEGESGAFRWVGESIASDNHRGRNEDSWLVFAPTNAVGVFDGVTVATGAADASARARTLFSQAAERLTQPNGQSAVAELVQILKSIDTDFLQTNRRRQGTHLAATAAIGQVVRLNHRPVLAYAAIGDTRIGIWHTQTRRYELAELDDGLLRMLLVPPSQRPSWVAKLLASHSLPADLHLPLAQAGQLATALDHDHDPAATSPLARTLVAERNLITQSLGSPQAHIHSGLLPVTAGDRVIFATDGIHDNLTENELTGIVAGANLAEAAAALVVRAREIAQSSSPRAKQDDMTAVIIEIK